MEPNWQGCIELFWCQYSGEHLQMTLSRGERGWGWLAAIATVRAGAGGGLWLDNGNRDRQRAIGLLAAASSASCWCAKALQCATHVLRAGAHEHLCTNYVLIENLCVCDWYTPQLVRHSDPAHLTLNVIIRGRQNIWWWHVCDSHCKAKQNRTNYMIHCTMELYFVGSVNGAIVTCVAFQLELNKRFRKSTIVSKQWRLILFAIAGRKKNVAADHYSLTWVVVTLWDNYKDNLKQFVRQCTWVKCFTFSLQQIISSNLIISI